MIHTSGPSEKVLKKKKRKSTSVRLILVINIILSCLHLNVSSQLWY